MDKLLKIIEYALMGTLIGILSFGCTDYSNEEELFIVDYEKEYPIMNLKLSDIADISFIQLGGKDSVKLLSSPSSFSNKIYIDDDYILIGDFVPYTKDGEWHRFAPQNAKLLMFNSKGDYLKTILRACQSDSGMIFHGMETHFEVSSNQKVIYAYSGNGQFIREFDFTGKIIKDNKCLLKKFSDIVLIGDTLALFDVDAQKIRNNGELIDKGASIKFYNVISGNFLQHPGHNFQKPYDSRKSNAPKKITKVDSGIYITTSRTDTVYFVNNNLFISPRFVAVRRRDDVDNLIYPLVETEDYILFCNGQDAGAFKNKVYDNANYLYMKDDKQIYKLPCSNAFPENREDVLWMDEFLLDYTYTTLIPNTLAAILPISFLKEKYDFLPDKLKRMTSSVSETENPILMVMKFGKALPK